MWLTLLSATAVTGTVLLMADLPSDPSKIFSLDMPRTADQIANQRFTRSSRGYNIIEVDRFLVDVAADYGRAVHLAQWAMEQSGKGSNPALDAISAQIGELAKEVRALTARVNLASAGLPVANKSSDWWPTEAPLSRVSRRRGNGIPAA
jgi:DivIVA domain-containing protein